MHREVGRMGTGVRCFHFVKFVFEYQKSGNLIEIFSIIKYPVPIHPTYRFERLPTAEQHGKALGKQQQKQDELN